MCNRSLGSPFLIHSGNVTSKVCKYWVFKSFSSHHVKAGLYIAENGRGVEVISFSRSRNDHGKKTEISMMGTKMLSLRNTSASNLRYEYDFVQLIENLRDWIVDLTNFTR